MQAALRAVFERWGLPERVRADNGWPWGTSSDLPTGLALWLIGLGIDVIHNHARSPQENGVVERFHGLIEPWAEPAKCPSFADWQERLAWLAQTQRERYPAVDGQTRLQAFPDLAKITRPYSSLDESNLFAFSRVQAHLAQGRWRRRVDKVGYITLYHRHYYAGSPYHSQEVFVHFDPQSNAWVAQDKDAHEIHRHPASEISPDAIINLEVNPGAKPKRPIHSPNLPTSPTT